MAAISAVGTPHKPNPAYGQAAPSGMSAAAPAADAAPLSLPAPIKWS